MKRSFEDAQDIGNIFSTLCQNLKLKIDKNDAYRLLDLFMSEHEHENSETIDIPKQCIIYVLELEDNKYYVGRSTLDGVEQRITEHKNLKASMWTSQHHFVKEILRKPGNEYAEDNTTLEYMQMKGIENVRGGSFCSIVLPDYQLKSIRDQLCTAKNCCYKCLQAGHFRSECPS